MNEMRPITQKSVVMLARGVRLQHDNVRGRTVLLAPERTIALDPVAVAIVEALDGTRDIKAVTAHLGASFDAPAEVIGPDVLAFVHQLAERRLLEVSR